MSQWKQLWSFAYVKIMTLRKCCLQEHHGTTEQVDGIFLQLVHDMNKYLLKNWTLMWCMVFTLDTICRIIAIRQSLANKPVHRFSNQIHFSLKVVSEVQKRISETHLVIIMLIEKVWIGRNCAWSNAFGARSSVYNMPAKPCAAPIYSMCHLNINGLLHELPTDELSKWGLL